MARGFLTRTATTTTLFDTNNTDNTSLQELVPLLGDKRAYIRGIGIHGPTTGRAYLGLMQGYDSNSANAHMTFQKGVAASARGTFGSTQNRFGSKNMEDVLRLQLRTAFGASDAVTFIIYYEQNVEDKEQEAWEAPYPVYDINSATSAANTAQQINASSVAGWQSWVDGAGFYTSAGSVQATIEYFDATTAMVAYTFPSAAATNGWKVVDLPMWVPQSTAAANKPVLRLNIPAAGVGNTSTGTVITRFTSES